MQAERIAKRPGKPKDVDAYIAAAPANLREKLRELRAVIRKTAPAAEERISYGMPYYDYKGRLAYFALAKAHIGPYIPPPVLEKFQGELKGYETTEATLRLPLDKRLPLPLIKKLIRARMKVNEARSEASR
jgi:uncharacterized protein YdhG (YjbR/CyaY superfamily)